jgi:transcriptional regulator with XRE-family HTH domain
VTYGERLRELRAERRLSLRQVEERGGPNKDTMSLIERDVHKPHPQTLGRIARALGMSVPELRGELEAAEYPLAQAPPSQPSFENHLRAEQQTEERRGEWENAVRNAHQLREHGQARVEQLLASWRESKNREEDPAKRRPYLDEIGEILQGAYDARPTLFQAMTYESLAEQWPELQKADEFYRELWHLVQSEGLSIRTGNAQEERPEAVEEREAA